MCPLIPLLPSVLVFPFTRLYYHFSSSLLSLSSFTPLGSHFTLLTPLLISDHHPSSLPTSRLSPPRLLPVLPSTVSLSPIFPYHHRGLFALPTIFFTHRFFFLSSPSLTWLSPSTRSSPPSLSPSPTVAMHPTLPRLPRSLFLPSPSFRQCREGETSQGEG